MGTGGAGDPLGQASGVPERDIRKLLHRAFDLGVNCFDTAPSYMDSECILGRALKGMPRDDVVVSTKITLAGSMPGMAIQIMKPEDIESAVDASLKRLGMDHVDLLLMSVAGPEYYDYVMNEQMPVLRQLQEKGKVRFLGSSEQSRSDGSHEWMRLLLASDAVDVVMVAYNMINQSARRLVHPVCVENDIGVLNIFTVRNVFRFPERIRETIMDLKERGLINSNGIPADKPLDWLLEDDQTESFVEAAYRFAAYSEGVTTVMMGTLNIGRLEENIRNILKGPLPEEHIEKLHLLFNEVQEPVGN